MKTTKPARPRKTAAPVEQPEMVALAAENEDLGMVPATEAQEIAKEHAEDSGEAVTIRHPVTDQVIEVVNPTTPTAEGEATTARDFKAEISCLKAAQGEELAKLRQRHAEEMALVKHQQASAKRSKPATRARVEGKAEDKTAELIALALRPEGVTPQELNEVSQWKGAPWRWNFSNPKGTGWAQKYGFSFRTEKGEDKRVRYFLNAV